MAVKTIKYWGLVLFMLTACGSGLDGRIEKRKDGNLYLVNTSKHKAYRFTVKETTTRNSEEFYETTTYELGPGEEENFGEESIQDKNVLQKYKYELTGQFELKEGKE